MTYLLFFPFHEPEILTHFLRFMHETEKTEMQNYLSRFVKNKYITVTIRIFRLK